MLGFNVESHYIIVRHGALQNNLNQQKVCMQGDFVANVVICERRWKFHSCLNGAYQRWFVSLYGVHAKNLT